MTAAGQATGISVSGGVPADTHTVVGADAPSRVLTGRVPDLTAAQLVGIVGRHGLLQGAYRPPC